MYPAYKIDCFENSLTLFIANWAWKKNDENWQVTNMKTAHVKNMEAVEKRKVSITR